MEVKDEKAKDEPQGKSEALHSERGEGAQEKREPAGQQRRYPSVRCDFCGVAYPATFDDAYRHQLRCRASRR